MFRRAGAAPAAAAAFRVLIGAAGAFLSVVALEAVLRREKPELDYFHALNPNERKTHHLEPGLMPGLALVSRYRTNSLGIRGREFSPRDDYRVLAIGCSVTISLYVDQDKTWTSLLERQLGELTGRRVWAGCIGRSEFTTRDIITVMRYFVPQYRESLDALVFLVGVNDLALMLSKRDGYDPSFLEKAGCERQWQRAFAHVPNRYSDKPAWRKLAVAKMALRMRSRIKDPVYAHEGAYYAAQRAARQKAKALLADIPEMTPGLDEFERNLNTIADLALANGFRPVFMTAPSLWRAGLNAEEVRLLWFGWMAGSEDYYSADALARGMALYNERLLDVCRRRGLECVDLAHHIPKNSSALYDDVHLNELGSALVADVLAQQLANRPVLSRPYHSEVEQHS